MRDNDIKIDNKFHYNFNYLNNPRLFNDLLLFNSVKFTATTARA
jgi:hypothetical protein